MGGPNVAITGNLVMMGSGNKESDICEIVFKTIANIIFLGRWRCPCKISMNLQITMLALAYLYYTMKKSEVIQKYF